MTERDQLPIPDFDHLPEPGLADRIRTLTADELDVLLDYERAHANRLPVVLLIERRRDAVCSGEAEPTGGDPAGTQVEKPAGTAHGSPVEDRDQRVPNRPTR